MKNFNWKESFMYVLAIAIVVGFFGLLWLLVKFTVPTENKDMLNIVIGALIGAFTMIVSYFFGSSKGSAEKTQILNDINKPKV